MPELNVPHLNYSSIITWFFALLVTYHYNAVKDYFCQNTNLTTETLPEPFETEKQTQKKQTKKKKAKKTKQQQPCSKTKKKDEEKPKNGIKMKEQQAYEEDEKEEEEEEDEWIDVGKIKSQQCIIPMKKDIKISEIEDNNNSLDTPDTTPHQSEDETSTVMTATTTTTTNNTNTTTTTTTTTNNTITTTSNNVKVKGWYSPFSTGLDLDILPKFTMDPLCQYKINFTPPSSPLIPNLLQQKQHQPPSSPKQSIIELLENHPFISTNHPLHHHQHTLGPIGENKSKFTAK